MNEISTAEKTKNSERLDPKNQATLHRLSQQIMNGTYPVLTSSTSSQATLMYEKIAEQLIQADRHKKTS